MIFSVEQGIRELPAILRGGSPVQRSSQDAEHLPLMGTQNYDRLPVAIVLGGGYDEDAVNSMREACSSIIDLPWLQFDRSTVPGQGEPQVGPGYGQKVADRVKARLQELAESGKMETDEVYLY